jgi:hypothetical protein
MMNTKSLIAATLLTGLAAVSFAQTPAAPKAATSAPVAVAAVAAPAPVAAASKPVKAKKHQTKKAAVSKAADATGK